MNDMIRTIIKCHSFHMVFFLLINLMSTGTTAADSLISISGSVMAAPSCVVNNNQILTIDFGNDLFTYYIDGSNYSQKIDYDYDCKKSNVSLRLRFDGKSLGTNGALQTSKSNLGIAFNAGGTLLPVGQWLTFNSENPPYITATLVKNGVNELTGGVFSAGAVLQVDFN